MISLAIVIGSGVVMWLRQGQSECFQDCVSEVHGKGSHLPWTKWERDGCWAVSSHLSCWVEKCCPRDVSSTDHKMWAFPEPRKITLWPLKLQGQCITGFLPSPCPNPSKELNGLQVLDPGKTVCVPDLPPAPFDPEMPPLGNLAFSESELVEDAEKCLHFLPFQVKDVLLKVGWYFSVFLISLL